MAPSLDLTTEKCRPSDNASQTSVRRTAESLRRTQLKKTTTLLLHTIFNRPSTAPPTTVPPAPRAPRALFATLCVLADTRPHRALRFISKPSAQSRMQSICASSALAPLSWHFPNGEMYEPTLSHATPFTRGRARSLQLHRSLRPRRCDETTIT